MNLFGQNLTSNEFGDISNQIMNCMVFRIKDKTFRICEIEMYLNNQTHNDPYVHSNQDQKNFGKFYFHKYSNGTYKSGTWKGMDIVLGNQDTYFGILIISIMDLDTNTFIEGPCKCVNKLLEQFDCFDVNELFNKRANPNVQIDLTDNWIRFEKNDLLEKKDIFVGKRIGLSDKYPEYQNKLYRYVIFENKIKKEKKI